MIPDAFEKISAHSDSVFAIWHSKEDKAIIVQFKQGLAKYQYQNATQEEVDAMNSGNMGGLSLGQYVRATYVVNTEGKPVTKLD